MEMKKVYYFQECKFFVFFLMVLIANNLAHKCSFLLKQWQKTTRKSIQPIYFPCFLIKKRFTWLALYIFKKYLIRMFSCKNIFF